MSLEHLPSINAGLNGLASLFLLGGWIAIKKQNRVLHQRLMIIALACSALFLCCYLYYHQNAGAMTPYKGEGVWRVVYFTILITHIPLAALIVPFAVAAVWFAIRKNFKWHTRITRWLWPTWMYVSVTGVLIYVMLYQL